MSRSPHHLKTASPDPAAAGTHDQSAFTLVELMVACAVLAVMLILISVTIGQVSKGVKTSTEKVDAFQSARTGLESVTRAVSVATLNTYLDYYVSNSTYQPRGSSTNPPQFYGRQSDLHFLATNLGNGGLTTLSGLTTVTHGLFFQAPLGYSTNTNSTPPGAVNGCGFFVAFGNDPTKPTNSAFAGLLDRPRFRLYQWLPSSDSLSVDLNTGRLTNSTWITPTNGVRPLAENIIAFVVRMPDTSSGSIATNATDYGWNSLTNWTSAMTNQPSQMHQLPPLINVTMVAIDEAAANRLINPTVTDVTTAITALGLPSDYTSRFTNNSQYDTDLQMVESALVARKIPYRVFTTTIPLRGSRWSQ
jgi:uncharacterized protein (TIGR02599 family)